MHFDLSFEMVYRNFPAGCVFLGVFHLTGTVQNYCKTTNCNGYFLVTFRSNFIIHQRGLSTLHERKSYASDKFFNQVKLFIRKQKWKMQGKQEMQ